MKNLDTPGKTGRVGRYGNILQLHVQCNRLIWYYNFIGKISAVYTVQNIACTVDFVTRFVNKSEFIRK